MNPTSVTEKPIQHSKSNSALWRLIGSKSPLLTILGASFALALSYGVAYFVAHSNIKSWLDLQEPIGDSPVGELSISDDDFSQSLISSCQPIPSTQEQQQVKEAELLLAINRCKFMIDSLSFALSSNNQSLLEAHWAVLNNQESQIINRSAIPSNILESSTKKEQDSQNLAEIDEELAKLKKQVYREIILSKNNLNLLQSIYYKDKPQMLKFLNKSSVLEGSESEKERLIEQIATSTQHKKSIKNRIFFFYSHYHAILSVLILVGLTTSICLFYVSTEGIAKVKHKPVFHVLLTCFISFGLLVNILNIFNFETNYRENRNLYIQHLNLEKDIHTYLVTNRLTTNRNNPNQVDRVEMNVFIASVDKRLKELLLLYIDANSDRVNQYIKDTELQFKPLQPPPLPVESQNSSESSS